MKLPMSGPVIVLTLLLVSVYPSVTRPAESRPLTEGVNHIGFSVSDLNATVDFFVNGLGWEIRGGQPSYPAIFVTDGLIFVTLWQTTEGDDTVAFDRKNNVGLHHFAMTVADVETLNELHTKLAAYPGVTVEFPPELNGAGPTVHLMIREPSGLRLEFAVPGGRSRSDSN